MSLVNLKRILLAAGFAFTVFNNAQGQAVSARGNAAAATPSFSVSGPVSYNTYQLPGGTWGYDILDGKRVIIRQHNIPGMPGMQGFRTQADAARTAALVISKIKKGQLPAITPDDLNALKLR